jgi:hypothetical protein
MATFTGEITAPKVAALEAMLELIGAVVPQGELAASVAAVVEPVLPLDSDTGQVWRRMLISRFSTEDSALADLAEYVELSWRVDRSARRTGAPPLVTRITERDRPRG